jgi:glycerol-3-phosphate dehydrogenase (NAD(P)+)
VELSGRVSVLGAGSWGTALAVSAWGAGLPVSLWTRRTSHAAELEKGHNARYLPGVEIPEGLLVTSDLARAVGDSALLVLAVPSHAVGTLCQDLRACIGDRALPVVCAAKGLERGTGRRMSEVMVDELSQGLDYQMVLLGPSHAEEVAERMPTAIVLSGGEPELAEAVQEALSTPWLRIYTNEDLVGTEYASALKNVLAIAAGICDGLGLGDNTKGALLTRGLAEIARLGVFLGAQRETFYGLSGVGDVITTCLSHHSRNRAFGERIGRGEGVEEALVAIDQVVEGVDTARTVVELARRHQVPMPISDEVTAVIDRRRDPRQAIEDLMGRALRSEHEPQAPRGG